jgi:hypothetical protein
MVRVRVAGNDMPGTDFEEFDDLAYGKVHGSLPAIFMKLVRSIEDNQ